MRDKILKKQGWSRYESRTAFQNTLAGAIFTQGPGGWKEKIPGKTQ